MKIHKEGRILLLVLLVLLAGINGVIYYFFPDRLTLQGITVIISSMLYLAILQFFRSPRIRIASHEKHVLAPADGKVVVIERVKETEYFKGERTQISVFMSPVNVHSNRNPVSGVIKYFEYHAGKYLVAWHPKSSALNERTTIVVERPDGIEVMIRQIAGALARRIKIYVKEGDVITQGEEFGFIKFGSRVDVILPVEAEVKVTVGDKTKAGVTVLAELPELQ